MLSDAIYGNLSFCQCQRKLVWMNQSIFWYEILLLNTFINDYITNRMTVLTILRQDWNSNSFTFLAQNIIYYQLKMLCTNEITSRNTFEWHMFQLVTPILWPWWNWSHQFCDTRLVCDLVILPTEAYTVVHQAMCHLRRSACTSL